MASIGVNDILNSLNMCTPCSELNPLCPLADEKCFSTQISMSENTHSEMGGEKTLSAPE